MTLADRPCPALSLGGRSQCTTLTNLFPRMCITAITAAVECSRSRKDEDGEAKALNKATLILRGSAAAWDDDMLSIGKHLVR